MEYKLRELKTKDIFAMSRILKKMELALDFNKKSQDQLGGELILSVVSNLYRAEEEVTAFLADLTGIDSAEIAELPLADTVELATKVFTLKGISGFFKQAGQSTK